MNAAYDMYAETNPAFISFLLYRFVKSYIESDQRGPHFSLSFVAVPIALSDRVQPSFSSTNATTGFLAWLNRFPEIRFGLQQDVEAANENTITGLRTALHGELLALDGTGRLTLGAAKKPPENTKAKLPSRPKSAVSRIERLGVWMSQAGRPSLIFSALEIRP